MKNKLLFIVFFCISHISTAATGFSITPNTITVTSTSDDGSVGTLRWAIDSANADPSVTQIDFTIGLSGTLTLTGDLPIIENDLTIVGSGSNNFTISGDNSFTMFNVYSGKTLTISHLAFTLCKGSSGAIFNANNSNVIAHNILVTGNANGSAFNSHENSTITIENSVFNDNAGWTLFESDQGSTPETTSDTETDYTNRISVSNTTFTNNSVTIFSTERYVKIDHCTFTNNSGQIGAFYGVNRYQIVNSTFTGNTNGILLAFGNSWIGDNPAWGEFTLGANNTLVAGNTFSNNTGLVINPGGSSYYDAKTTITDNVFLNNGTNWSGTPAVSTPNIFNNFFSSVNHVSANNTIIVTMSRPIFSTNGGTGLLDVTDFEFSLSGGTATLGSATPTSISNVGNVYTLGIDISGTVDGTETLTVSPVSNSIFDATTNIAYTSQANNTTTLNLPDDDSDGVPNSLDSCPETSLGTIVGTDGCEDITPPATPIGITSYAGNFNVTLNWTANSDDAIGYKIYGGTDQNNLSLLSTTADTNYVQTGLSTTTTYYYTIVAYDLAGNNSTASGVINETTTEPIIWSSPSITFQKADNANFNLPQNQDILTNNVKITRKANRGLYNYAAESQSDGYGGSSPIDTEWARGTLVDIASLNYQTWSEAFSNDPPSNVNDTFVVHLITDNIYFELTLLQWTSGGNGGGFSYSRTTPCAQTTSSSSIKLANGSTFVTSLSAQSNWTISGGADQGLFSISNNYILSFSSPANYDSNASNTYYVIVNDGCETKNLTITISPLCGTW